MNAVLGPIITLDRTVTLDIPVTVGSITFNESDSTTSNYRLQNGSGNWLTLDVASGSAAISMAASNQADHEVASPIVLNDPLVINNSSALAANTLFFSKAITNSGNLVTVTGSRPTTFVTGVNGGGTIYGTGGLTKTGTGVLTIGIPMQFTGALTIEGGTLLYGANNIFQDNVPITVTGPGVLNYGNKTDTIGSLTVSGGTVSGTGTLTLNGDVAHLASAAPSTISGNLNLGFSSRVFTVADGGADPDLDISAVITGSVGITKEGAGALRLSGANSYSGGTVINGGRLIMAERRALDSGSLTINNGAQLEVAFASNIASPLGGITINSGSIQRTDSSNGRATFLGTVTAAGSTVLRDAGGDGNNGFLNLGGAVTVQSGATLTLDAVNANDEVRLDTGSSVTVQAGGSIVTTGNGTKQIGGSGGAIVGQGSDGSGQESTILLNSGASRGSGASFQVNGGGTRGLRVEGSKSDVENFVLNSNTLLPVGGSGGTLTIAFNDGGSTTFRAQPSGSTSVQLGFDAAGGSPTYQLGNSDNDLTRWNGLVVKGGTVQVRRSQSFTGTGSSSLTVSGGTLAFDSSRSLTFGGDATLSGGVISGNTGSTISIGGSLHSGGTTLQNSPNITMTTSGSASLDGSAPLNGVGTFSHAGSGTVTLSQQISATLLDVNQGTLLLGASHRIGDSTPVRLSNGATLATDGFSDDVGALTLASGSSLDLGAGASVLRFADSSLAAWSGILTIKNWTGSSVGGGSDQVIFGSSSAGITGSQLAQIRFLDPFGLSPGLYAARILPSGEVVPIPEPEMLFSVALLVLATAWRERSRLLRIPGFFKRCFDSNLAK